MCATDTAGGVPAERVRVGDRCAAAIECGNFGIVGDGDGSGSGGDGGGSAAGSGAGF